MELSFKKVPYNKLNIYLNETYKFLLANGFYNIVNEYNINSQYLDSIPEIPNWNDCLNRADKIQQYYLPHLKNLGIEFFESPCRLGRNMTECSFNIKNRKLSRDILNNCVFCQTINNTDNSLCYPFRQYKMIYIDGLVILPNPFPYFKKQFLITADVDYNSDHYTQTIFKEDFSYFFKVLKVANELCKQKDGIVFFNGLCGNSLKHFHCQFATHRLPIFSFLDDHELSKENFIKIEPNIQVLFNDDSNKYFRGIVFSNMSLEDLGKKAEVYINELTKLGYLYNFIIRKKRSKLQMVLFVRNCKTKKGTVDFNFGSTELGGAIVKLTKFDNKLKEKDIVKYLNETNNVKDIVKVVKSLAKIMKW